MNEQERKELLRYFTLCSYRDGEYILLEEYEELESIIKNNKIARYLEDVRFKYLTRQINEEEYNSINNNYFNKLILAKE